MALRSSRSSSGSAAPRCWSAGTWRPSSSSTIWRCTGPRPSPPDVAGTDGDVVRLEAVVHGRVQGVGFRLHVVRAAAPLGLEGWVANQDDGTVRCVAEGPRDRLEALLGVLRTGPPGARVERVGTP